MRNRRSGSWQLRIWLAVVDGSACRLRACRSRLGRKGKRIRAFCQGDTHVGQVVRNSQLQSLSQPHRLMRYTVYKTCAELSLQGSVKGVQHAVRHIEWASEISKCRWRPQLWRARLSRKTRQYLYIDWGPGVHGRQYRAQSSLAGKQLIWYLSLTRNGSLSALHLSSPFPRMFWPGTCL